jgi:hypothetical protein
MQSSTAIAFRALIMLIILISVPLVAIFGRDLPEFIKGLIDGRLSVQLSEQPKGTGGPVSSSPSTPGIGYAPPTNNPFAEAAPYRAAPAVTAAAPPNTTTNPTVPANLAPPAALASPPGMTSPAPPAVVPPAHSFPPVGEVPSVSPSAVTNAGMTAPANTLNPSAANPNLPSAPGRPESFQPPPESRPIGVSESVRPGDPTDDGSTRSPLASGNGDDKFRLAETRLKELGATHYVLETWGPQNEQYRFACRMAVGGNVGVNRHFEAVEDDPWRAMESVLRQVEDWQKQSP